MQRDAFADPKPAYGATVDFEPHYQNKTFTQTPRAKTNHGNKNSETLKRILRSRP